MINYNNIKISFKKRRTYVSSFGMDMILLLFTSNFLIAASLPMCFGNKTSELNETSSSTNGRVEISSGNFSSLFSLHKKKNNSDQYQLFFL